MTHKRCSRRVETVEVSTQYCGKEKGGWRDDTKIMNTVHAEKEGLERKGGG